MFSMLTLIAGLVLVYLGFCVLVGSFIAAGGGGEPEDPNLWPR